MLVNFGLPISDLFLSDPYFIRLYLYFLLPLLCKRMYSSPRRLSPVHSQ